MSPRYSVFDLGRIDDSSGTIHIAEFEAIGYTFRRWYFITGVPADVRRGNHAHKAQTECLVCVQGSVTVHVEADAERSTIVLDEPGRALLLPAGYWRELVEFSADAILAVLASHAYREADYIRDLGDFHAWERSSRP